MSLLLSLQSFEDDRWVARLTTYAARDGWASREIDSRVARRSA